MWGVATQKKPKKNSPKFEICVAFGFFRCFFGFFRFFRYFSVFCGTFSVFFGLNFDKKFQSFKNHVNNEVLGGQELPNNILNAYKAIISKKNHSTRMKKPLNQSKLAKMEKPKKKKPKKPKKNRKKPVPNLKFAVAFGFFGLHPPPPPNVLKYSALISVF